MSAQSKPLPSSATITDIMSYHPEFIDEDADLLILSSDSIAFKIHQMNIDTHSSVFAPFPANKDEYVCLSETAGVLEILFKYIYPTATLPDLSKVSFSLLNAVAIAADKYQFSALSVICDIHMYMKEALQTETIAVYQYACIRQNQEMIERCDAHMEANAVSQPAMALRYALIERKDEAMADRVAVYTLAIQTAVAANEFNAELFRRWIIFREAWAWNIRGELGGPVTCQSLQKKAIRIENIPAYSGVRFSETRQLDVWRSSVMNGKLLIQMMA
ncbi:hypothetical protein BDZ89DRAFT_1163071 [Hymenopellis radicata]|nr:hypothetical protein BDZ89DRAFT_1163071 [Hymenopellis radicata]